MSDLQQSIAEKFLDALAKSGSVDAHVSTQLRTLLANGAKPKADELVKIFTSLPDVEVK